MPDALAGQVEQFTNLFECNAAAVGDIQGARLGQLPDLQVGEVQFDGARVGVHIQIEVKLARDIGTGTIAHTAVFATDRAKLLNLFINALDLRALVGAESF